MSGVAVWGINDVDREVLLSAISELFAVKMYEHDSSYCDYYTATDSCGRRIALYVNVHPDGPVFGEWGCSTFILQVVICNEDSEVDELSEKLKSIPGMVQLLEDPREDKGTWDLR